MTELSQIILDEYQVRKTKKQKFAFITLLQKYLPNLTIQEGGFPKNRNLMIGNPETAKIILSAHYDTCTQLPFPNFITPKKPLISILYSILIAMPVIILLFAFDLLIFQFARDPLIKYCTMLFVYIVFMWLLLAGPANKHTANDNTSGVITLLEIYQKMDVASRNEVCFVFFDNEEAGLLGSGYFRKKFRKIVKNKLLINFDCVSDGDHFLLGITKKANQKYHVAISRAFTSTDQKHVMLENLKKVYYPSDQAGFPMAIAVAALNYKKAFGYYMNKIHTKKDTVFEEDNITYLAEHTIQLIQNM